MGKGLISLMFAAGVAAWLYSHFQQTSGNNTQRSLVAAAICGGVAFIMFFTVLSLVGI